MPKIKNLKLVPQRRVQSLADQIITNRTGLKKSNPSSARNDADDEFETGDFGDASDTVDIEERLTARILQQAREQQSEVNHGDLKDTKPKKTSAGGIKFLAPIAQSSSKSSIRVRPASDEAVDDDDDNDDDEELQEHAREAAQYDESPLQLDEADEKAWNLFSPVNVLGDGGRQSLTDTMREKLAEKKIELESQFSEPASVLAQKHHRLHPRVVSMYKGVGQVLARYRSGKVPKAFKIIPRLQNWEQILYLTEPDRWSAAAMFQATKLFASNMNPKLAQRFYNLVLLPRVRDDIAEYKQLNFHLYQALRKALFKPAAFLKGILLPLAESGNCTLREAVIIGSVLTRNSIPMLHSAAAMLRLAEMQQYNGSSSVFLKALIEKRYALPFRVTDAVVHHFLRFSHEKRKLPVLWHQCLLAFVDNYKADISSDQKEELLDLLRYQPHYQITPEVRRLLINSRCRDVEEALMGDQPNTENESTKSNTSCSQPRMPTNDVEME